MLGDERLRAWFAQNACSATGLAGAEKLNFLPIGLDLHSVYLRGAWGERAGQSPRAQEDALIAIAQRSKPFAERIPHVFAGWSNNSSEAMRAFGLEDQDALGAALKQNALVVFSPTPYPSRSDYWTALASYQFVFAPVGHGLDTHRLWEALLLGCIVLTQASPMAACYTSDPVVCVSRPGAITTAALETWRAELASATRASLYNPRYRMATWIDRIRNDSDNRVVRLTR